MLDAAGTRRGGREHLQGPAADGDLAGLIHPLVKDVAKPLQLGRHRGEVDRIADGEGDPRPIPGFGRWHPLDQRRAGG